MFTKPMVVYFTIDVNQTIMLYTLNFYSDVYQIFFNKTGEKLMQGKLRQEKKVDIPTFPLGSR